MRIKDWREVVTADWPKQGPITEATREATVAYAQSGRGHGDFRISTGRFYTNEEYGAWRERVLSRQLP